MRKSKAKIIVAMSGGVDSSVSAALLKRAGFSVTGMFMKCWASLAGLNPAKLGGLSPDIFRNTCTADDDERMARLAAEKIGIPFYSINLVKEYKARVVEYLLEGYRQGITPNPDVMCNKEIKFGLFFDKAMAFGADYVATGHYARLWREARNPKSEIRILQAKDANKDQSYFLAFIKPEILDRVMFPIGEYTKPEVRMLARKFGLPNAERKDSQGICFVGKVDFVEFLKLYIPSKIGDIVDTQGNVLGQHEGAVYYTIGQRKGLGLSGGPYFIVDKDVQKNIVVVSKDERDLFKTELQVKNLNWFGMPAQGKVTCRIRYRQSPSLGTLHIDKSAQTGRVVFNSPQRAITPGQMAVLYRGDQMLAGGVIK